MQPKWPTALSIWLLGLWFVLTGAFTVFNLTFDSQGILMGILAVVIGILLLIGR